MWALPLDYTFEFPTACAKYKCITIFESVLAMELLKIVVCATWAFRAHPIAPGKYTLLGEACGSALTISQQVQVHTSQILSY